VVARTVDAIGVQRCRKQKGGSAVRNFLAGILLGWFATYWYLTQGEYLRVMKRFMDRHSGLGRD